MANTKYRKKPTVMVDLSDRKNMQIIPIEHILSTDEDIKDFENKLESRYNNMKDFSNYCIQQKNTDPLATSISDEVFQETMYHMLKKHKLLKSMLKEANS